MVLLDLSVHRMVGLMKFLFVLFAIYLTNINYSRASSQPNSECTEWFKQGGIKSETKNCELECSTLKVDMETFICPNQCDVLCKQKESSSIFGKLLYYPGLTPSEKELVEKYPKDALIVFIQKTRAELSSGRNFPDQDLNDESDAFRHFIWAGLLTKELGKEKAKLFLDAHEVNRLQRLSEKQMDTYNNKMGQESATILIRNKKWSLKNLEAKGLRALKSKKLKVLKPGLKIPEKPR